MRFLRHLGRIPADLKERGGEALCRPNKKWSYEEDADAKKATLRRYPVSKERREWQSS